MGSTAVEQDGLVIPIINFSDFLSGSPESKAATAKAILTAFRTSGFLYLSHTPIPPDLLTSVFVNSASFFDHGEDFKKKYLWTTPDANRGYSAPGREKVTQLTKPDEVESLREKVPDLKESFEIGREDEPGHPNCWPELAGFREVMTEFHRRCHELNVEVMRAIAVGMGLGEGFFDGFVDRGDNTLRLLHYPAVGKERFEQGAIRAGEHSDYGSITLLFQDGRGGLQVRAPGGRFVDARPVEGTVVVNAGDLLARWANDGLKSTIHRVVEPPPPKEEGGSEEVKEYPARYSVAYFCNPNFDSFIEAIPGTYGGEKGEKKYKGIYSGEYLVQRLSATY